MLSEPMQKREQTVRRSPSIAPNNEWSRREVDNRGRTSRAHLKPRALLNARKLYLFSGARVCDPQPLACSNEMIKGSAPFGISHVAAGHRPAVLLNAALDSDCAAGSILHPNQGTNPAADRFLPHQWRGP